jgi:hypothetical protein
MQFANKIFKLYILKKLRTFFAAERIMKNCNSHRPDAFMKCPDGNLNCYEKLNSSVFGIKSQRPHSTACGWQNELLNHAF